MEHAHRRIVGVVVAVLQDVDPHHEVDGLCETADAALILGQGVIEIITINQRRGMEKLVVRFQDLGQPGF